MKHYIPLYKFRRYLSNSSYKHSFKYKAKIAYSDSLIDFYPSSRKTNILLLHPLTKLLILNFLNF